jgi:hypothetical protein
MFLNVVAHFNGVPGIKKVFANETTAARRHTKSKRKRHLYLLTQDFYNKDPSTLAKFIYEGVPWLEDQEADNPQEVIERFYINLWDAYPEATLSFDITEPTDTKI